jgi:hypothetical protein
MDKDEKLVAAFVGFALAAFGYLSGYDRGHREGEMSTATRRPVPGYEECLVEDHYNSYEKVYRWRKCNPTP